MTAAPQKPELYWHFDKTAIGMIVGVIVALIAQTVSFVWWASGLSSNVTDQGRRIVIMETWIGAQHTAELESIKSRNAQDIKIAEMGIKLEVLSAKVVADQTFQNWKEQSAGRAALDREQKRKP
jgi:hypothetical protein